MQPGQNEWLALREPLPAPAINPELEMLRWIPRSTECLRYFVLSVEFWISPGGRLRQWTRLNLCLAAYLFIPAIVLMPVIGLVLHEVDGWLSMLLSIVWKLILLSIIVFVVVCVIKHRRKHFPSPRGSPNTRHRKRRTPPSGGIAF